MKKSLLLIDVCCFFVVLASCHNTTSLNHKKTDADHVFSISPAASGTSKTSEQTPVTGSAGNDQGKIKDTNSNQDGAQAFVHHSPDDRKTDSIKNLKAKLKK